ncbi:MAG: hypothetical protein DRP76_03250, partial [Candidatus Omnitrophota bacterium]
MDIKKFLLQNAQKYPYKEAVIFQDSKINFSQLKELSFKLSNYLLDNKIKKVAIFLPNNLENLISFLGVFSSQDTTIPLDFMLTEEELIHLIN